jgi:hypothetical protein
MNSEDCERWQGLLDQAIAQALDEGHDEVQGHIVLCTLASSISSHNSALLSSNDELEDPSAPRTTTAPASPATRLADLLLTTLVP